MDSRQIALNAILARTPVIPVVVIEREADALPLARALVAGGIDVLEITLRSDAAWLAAESIAASMSEMVVGVGTVTDSGQLRRAIDVDLDFAVSPGCTPALIQAACDCDIPFLPGIATVSEAMLADESGFSTLKFFPAVPAGGIAMLKAIAGPLPHLRFCPTGGISQANAAEFLALGNVACVGGSWVTPPRLIQAQDWDTITKLARSAVALRAKRRTELK